MFISKAELETIKSQIEFLQELASKFQSEINAIKAKKSTEDFSIQLNGKHKKPRSAESKAIQSERMKAAWAAKKARALAT
jgi:hypothetical protein